MQQQGDSKSRINSNTTEKQETGSRPVCLKVFEAQVAAMGVVKAMSLQLNISNLWPQQMLAQKDNNNSC